MSAARYARYQAASTIGGILHLNEKVRRVKKFGAIRLVRFRVYRDTARLNQLTTRSDPTSSPSPSASPEPLVLPPPIGQC